MNDLDAKTIIGLLGDILAELRKAPAPRSAPVSGARQTDSHTGALIPPDEPWARFKWPQFCDKMGYLAKRNEVTIGDSIRTEGGRKSAQYWIDKFVVKGDRDVAFRDALDACKAWLSNPRPESRPVDRSPAAAPAGAADSEDGPFERFEPFSQ